MSEPAQDPEAQLAGLCLAGAAHHDPVTVHYLQVLLARTAVHQGRVRRLLEAKLAHGLQALALRLAQAQRDVPPAAAGADPSASRAPLRELTRYLAQRVPERVDASHVGVSAGAAGARPELKSVQQFRNTWSKLSVDKQMAKALDQAPKNAGPINSHMLVLRSLALMREISPDYLNRFMSYADALLCLDQSGQAKSVQAKKPLKVKPAKK